MCSEYQERVVVWGRGGERGAWRFGGRVSDQKFYFKNRIWVQILFLSEVSIQPGNLMEGVGPAKYGARYHGLFLVGTIRSVS